MPIEPLPQQPGSQPIENSLLSESLPVRARSECITPSREKIPRIFLNGGPHEIGLQHGRTLSFEIAETFSFYRQKLFSRFDDEQIKAHSLAFLDQLQEHFPAYAEEVKGIAEGSGMEAWQIMMINARTELISIDRNFSVPDECTAAFLKESSILGQNWDWEERFETLAVIMDITREDGHRILTLTEPGMLGKIGMNSSGVGVTLNILSSEEPVHHSIPIHVLLRGILDCQSALEAVDLINNSNTETNSNIIVSDATGHFVDVEFSGKNRDALPSDKILIGEGVAIHANGYLAERSGRISHETNWSRKRYARAVEIANGMEEHSVEGMKQLLSDRSNPHFAIMKEFAPDEDDSSWRTGTVASVIMDLGERKFYVTRSKAVNGVYEELTFSDRE